MIDRKRLREVARYMPATSGDHEFIWLQSEAEGAISNEGRLWCYDKVWGACSGDDEPTCYVRADIAVDLLDRLDRVEGLLKRAGEALAPFGRNGSVIAKDVDDDLPLEAVEDRVGDSSFFNVGHLRAARAIATEIEETLK